MRAVRTLMRIVGRTLVGLAGPSRACRAAAVAGRIAFERQMAGKIDALLAAGRPAASGTVCEGDLQVSCAPVEGNQRLEVSSHQDPPSSE
jgi:hypothetical protein